jgi:hypothetical protein
MQTEETKEKKEEAKCCEFKEVFKDFQIFRESFSKSPEQPG